MTRPPAPATAGASAEHAVTGAQPAASDALSTLELDAWRGFLRAHAGLTRELDEELERGEGLSLTEYDVLVQLADAPEAGLRMSELAEAVLLSRSGLTRLVDDLERRGLVERARCPEDARGLNARITERGHRRRSEAAATHLEGVRRRFHRRLSDDQLEELQRVWRSLMPGAVDG